MKESRNKQMSRLQAIDILHKFEQAMDNREFRECAHLLGITDEMAESMSHDDITQSMAVRLADICRIAGVFE